MSDTVSQLEGEETIIPSIAAPKGQANRTRMVVATIVLLALVGIVGFILWRIIHHKLHPDAGARDTAGTIAEAPTLRMPPPSASDAMASPAETTASGAAAAPAAGQGASSQAVPSLAVATSEGEAIPVHGSGGRPTSTSTTVGGSRKRDPEDAPIFPADTAPDLKNKNVSSYSGGSMAYGAGPSAATNPNDLVANAKAANAQYKQQLNGLMEALQQRVAGNPAGQQTVANILGPAGASLGSGGSIGTSTATSARTGPTQFAQGAAQSGGGANSPPLFGSMEKTSTPRVQASMLGDRSMILPMGTTYQCDLKTKVVTATSGFVGCNVIRNVFSENGKVVLMERGTHLDGEYRIVQVKPGMTRIPVLWTRARTPNGVIVPLDSPSTGELGESGMGGYVDNRWGERLGAALMLSLIQDAVQYQTQKDTSTSSDSFQFSNTSNEGSKMADEVLSSTINIPPLLYQNQGSIVGVYVSRDIDFSSVYELQPQ